MNPPARADLDSQKRETALDSEEARSGLGSGGGPSVALPGLCRRELTQEAHWNGSLQLMLCLLLRYRNSLKVGCKMILHNAFC